MKTPIILFVLSLSLFTGFAWHFQRQLSSAREKQAKMLGETSSSITTINSAAASVPVRPERSKTGTKTTPPTGRALAARYIAWSADAYARRDAPAPPDPAIHENFLKLIDQMAELNPTEIKLLTAEICADEKFNMQIRRSLIARAVYGLTPINPRNAIELLTNSQEVFVDDSSKSTTHLMGEALSSWSKKDFPTALDWLRQNADSHAELIDDQTKAAVVGNYDGKDFRAAFALIAEVGINEPYTATQRIIKLAKTAEERTEALAALREYLPTISPSDRPAAGEYAIEYMGQLWAKDGFQPAIDWIESANLTPKELSSFSKHLGSSANPGDEAKWIEWFGSNLPPNGIQRPVARVIDAWVKRDHQAVSTWLTGSPESPGKQAAVFRFATEVASYEPEVAAQWALTLPEGNVQKKCLEEVYDNWPKKDEASKAAAEAFAQLHHLK